MDEEKDKSMMGEGGGVVGMGCGEGLGWWCVCCLLEVPEGCRDETDGWK